VGPLVPPGVYTLKLTVDGKAYTQWLTVQNDPRTPAKAADVRAQYALQMKIVAGMQISWDGYHQVAAGRTAVAADTAAALPTTVIAAARAFDSTLARVGGDPENLPGFGGGGGGRPAPPPSFAGVNDHFVKEINGLENGDMAPTEAMRRAYAARCTELKTVVTTWTAIKDAALATFNTVLAQHSMKPIAASATTLVAPGCSKS
jgi:hypothetical protein